MCTHCTLTLEGFSLCLLEKIWLPNLWVYSLPVGQKTPPCINQCIGVGPDAPLNTSCKERHYLRKPRYILLPTEGGANAAVRKFRQNYSSPPHFIEVTGLGCQSSALDSNTAKSQYRGYFTFLLLFPVRRDAYTFPLIS